MTTWQEALEIIHSHLEPLAPAKVPLGSSFGLVAAEDALSAEMLPLFDNSAMDGKRHFLRVFAAKGERGWAARLSGPQGSAQL
jgi:molybdopterin biosynthesis enzyme